MDFLDHMESLNATDEEILKAATYLMVIRQRDFFDKLRVEMGYRKNKRKKEEKRLAKQGLENK